MADKTLVCKDCGAEFVFTEGEQAFYAEKGFDNEPQNELDHYYKTEPIHRMYLGEVVDIID